MATNSWLKVTMDKKSRINMTNAKISWMDSIDSPSPSTSSNNSATTEGSGGSMRSSSPSTLDSSDFSDARLSSLDTGVELFGIQLEVTARLLDAEQRKLEVLQQELILELSNVNYEPNKRYDVEQLKTSIRRIREQYSILEYEYKVAAMGALKRHNQRKRSSRSQPAIGLKQTPKSRPTIFGTIAAGKSPADAKRRQSVEPQTLSLSQMFDLAGSGYELHTPSNTDALIFENGNLVCGSIDALIQHLVPTPNYHPDRTYIFAFILSSRIYMRPHTLLREVYQMCVYQQKLTDHSVKKDKLGKFGPHVIKLMNEWSELFPYDFRDERMMKHLRDLTQRIVGFYPELRKDVTNMIHNLVNRLTSLQRYEDILSKLNTEVIQKSQSNLMPTTDMLEICTSPLQLAQQLTHIELERLSQIGPEEFIQTFTKDKTETQTTFRDMKKTSNLESYIQWFNRLSYLVATEICTHLKKKNRVRMIEFFIDVAKECINIGNFNSLMAIIAGMNMSPVTRLKKTWDKVNQDKFRILEHQMDPSSNFSVYRSCLKAAMWRSDGAMDEREKIVIPFFSLFIKDLYFLNECCTNRINDGHINFQKFWQLAKQISEFMTWQHVVCPFEKNTEILHYLLTAPIFTETTLSLASFECEIPENNFDKQRHKMLKAQAGL